MDEKKQEEAGRRSRKKCERQLLPRIESVRAAVTARHAHTHTHKHMCHGCLCGSAYTAAATREDLYDILVYKPCSFSFFPLPLPFLPYTSFPLMNMVTSQTDTHTHTHTRVLPFQRRPRRQARHDFGTGNTPQQHNKTTEN